MVWEIVHPEVYRYFNQILEKAPDGAYRIKPHPRRVASSGRCRALWLSGCWRMKKALCASS